MKKKLSLLLAILLLLSLLSGCIGETDRGEVSPTLTASAVPTVTGSLLSQQYEAVSENLYHVNGLIPEGSYVHDSELFDNTLAVIYEDSSDGVTYLTLFGIYDNAVLAKVAITFGSPQLQVLDDGCLAVIDTVTAKALVFDSSLQKISEFGGYGSGYSFQWFYCEPDGSGIWAGGDESGDICFFPMGSGETQKYSIGQNTTQYLLSAMGNKLLLETYDTSYSRVIYSFDRNTHSVFEEPQLESAYPFSGDALYFTINNAIAYTPTDGMNMLYSFSTQEKNESLSDYERGLLTTISTTFGGADENYATHQAIRVYDERAQRLTAELQLPEELSADYTVTSALIAEDGYVLLTLCSDSTETYCEYYLWEYSEQHTSSTVQFMSINLDKLDEYNDQKATELGAKYGVEIFVAETGAAIEGSGYSAAVITDSFLTYSALLVLDDFLSKFPDGMIGEMKVGSTTVIQIYLCGTLKAEDEYGISSAAALAAELGDRQLIVANINILGMLEQNLSHEFMHLCEDRIWAYGEETGNYYLSYWTELVPEELGENAYLYSYHDQTGFEASDNTYTWYDERFSADCSIAWFIDAYSRTYPTEDRARIFEYLFSAGDSLADCFRSENLMNKAKYLCAVIRACFQSTQNTDKLWWERYIVPADISEFSYVPEAVG